MKTHLKSSVRWALLAMATSAQMAGAADGLVAPAADLWWPGWQARIALQTNLATPLHAARWAQAQAEPQGSRGVAGAALLGDYTFTRAWLGAWRATSGLVAGSLPGTIGRPAPLAWGGNVTAEAINTVPYVGLGFSRQALNDSLSIVADVGVVASSPTNFGNLGRAVFGNAGVENAWRDMRLSPMWQLGVRYAF